VNWVRLSMAVGLMAVIGSFAGCMAPPGFDYSAYRAHRPRSILVLPPRNESNIVQAPYVYLSTITRPLAECGYYVFPVAVIDAFMKENGLPTAEEMHGVSLQKIREVIGADAVLYVTIEDWGQKYLIVQSVTVVKARAQLVDTVSGDVIWQGRQYLSQSSGGGDPLGSLISATLTQVFAWLSDPTYPLIRRANYRMLSDPDQGLLLGPYRSYTQENDHCLDPH